MLTRDDLDRIYAKTFPRITVVSGRYIVEQDGKRSFRIYPPSESLLNATVFDTLTPEQRRDMSISYMRAFNRYDPGAIEHLEKLLLYAPLQTN